METRVLVIVGSVRSGRFGAHVGGWVQKALLDTGVDVDLVDLAELTFPHTMDGHSDAASFAERVGWADAIVVVTPEYNHSYPGPLKSAIDSVRDEWKAKPVGFVSYGGMSGGLRAVEALRLVFAELHAVTVRDCVSLHNPWGKKDYPGPAERDALLGMLRQLTWWARALGNARATVPYPA
ncbi:NADPH-dependent FMN reductase [Amycolatopsis sacchari]|uniref:NADPH-dependent FMN reductase n=1 Tax=Amycolatopsis sacchari TaxID=115433 RepID=UPI003D74A956